MLMTIKQLAVTFKYLLVYSYTKELYLHISIHSKVTLSHTYSKALNLLQTAHPSSVAAEYGPSLANRLVLNGNPKRP